MKNHRQFLVWRESYRLVFTVYNATVKFPKDAPREFVSQICYAVGAIPSNIAEGCWRDTESELAHFSTIAMNSAKELEDHLLRARDLNFLDDAKYTVLNDDLYYVKRMLHIFMWQLQNSQQL